MLTFDGACWKFMGDHVVTNAHSLCQAEGARLPLPRRLGISNFYDLVLDDQVILPKIVTHQSVTKKIWLWLTLSKTILEA